MPTKVPLLWTQIKQNLQDTHKNRRLLNSVLNSISPRETCLKGQKHFVLFVPSGFHHNFLRTFLPEIKQHLKNHGIFHLSVEKQEEKKIPALPAPRKTKTTKKPNPLFKEFTFSSFVCGSGSQFAFATAKKLAQNLQNPEFNPVFIYGSTGLGKTHLLLAIRHHIQQHFKSVKVSYLSAERFLNEYISHIRKNNMGAFRTRYREDIQLLLLDDCQILSRGDLVQDEFFHTFEHLIQKNCQMVFAGDQAPKHINKLKLRLKTCLSGGLVIPLHPPDTETKKILLKKAAASLKLPPFSEESLSYLRRICEKSSTRELLGCVKTIKMFCELQNIKPRFSLIKKLFPYEPVPLSPSLKVEHLKQTITRFFNLAPKDLISKNRQAHITRARHIAFFLTTELCHLSASETGRVFGGKDHSSVLYALKKIKNQLPRDVKLRQNLHILRETCLKGQKQQNPG